MKFKKNLQKLTGDASHRIFFRNKNKKSSSIFVYAKKDKTLNLLVYDAINKILVKNKILAPKLLSENFSKNYIEIQDFGNQTLFDLLNNKKYNKFLIFKKAIQLLTKIQLIKERKIKNFKKKNYIIPYYTEKVLLKEAQLFSDWYAAKRLEKHEIRNFKKNFSLIIKNLIKKLHFKNKLFVHRDFHVSNLMMVKNEIGVIDSQDALIGNKAYDLASLIDDVRFKTSIKLKKKSI